ncbi:hypothetical protein SJY04_09075 [Aeromonas dhakensis]|uniref:hypothetical protein n=1 Tax=Aeromonas dhakensis TaxID=196024 RepID=UPI00191FDA1C|nr:hypothetical protein [Aeromonas dhakensis]MBL0675016.1 hypothetical protein [Aeromonas dhakensis]MDX7741273.1 hypothetical protein [Aeromonas dhakensis]
MKKLVRTMKVPRITIQTSGGKGGRRMGTPCRAMVADPQGKAFSGFKRNPIAQSPLCKNPPGGLSGAERRVTL